MENISVKEYIQGFLEYHYLSLFWIVFLCSWYPLYDPSYAKLIVLPLLPFLMRKCSRYQLYLMGTATIILLALPVVFSWDRKYLFIEASILLFFALGLQKEKKELATAVFWTAALSLIFYLLQVFHYLPWQWNQPILVFEQEYLGETYSLPSLFSNPSPMCLVFALGFIPLKFKSLKLKLLYGAICLPMIVQSTSTLGTASFFFSFLWCLIPRINLKNLVFAAVISLIILPLVPEMYFIRPFQTRKILITSAISGVNLLGHGPSGYQRLSSTLLPAETTSIHMSRNQFHPHNDLLYYLFSYGILGLLLRLLFTILILKKIDPQSHFPLYLYLIHIQFTPDALSIPLSMLAGYLMGNLFSTTTHSTKTLPLLPTMGISLILGMSTFQLLSDSRDAQNIKTAATDTRLFFSSPSIAFNRAVAYLKEKKYQSALDCINELQKHAPDYTSSNYLKAHCLISLNQWDKAENALIAQLKIDPFHLYSRLFLADILLKDNKKQKAERYLKEGVTLFPHNSLLQQKLDALR
jgi:hypothetical protein